MPFSKSFSFSSSSHYSYTSAGGATRSGHVVQQSTKSDPSGTTINRKGRQLGGPTIQETQRYDSEGNPVLEDGSVFIKGRAARARRGIEEREKPIERRIVDVEEEEGKAEDGGKREDA